MFDYVPVVFDKNIEGEFFNHGFLKNLGLLVFVVEKISGEPFFWVNDGCPFFEIGLHELVSGGYDIGLDSFVFDKVQKIVYSGRRPKAGMMKQLPDPFFEAILWIVKFVQVSF